MGIFVGREAELATLVDNLDEGGRLVLISGEPGIGKTRLAEELGRRAQARGGIVAWGRAWEGEGTPAYWAWLQIVRRLRPTFEPLFDALLHEWPELAALVAPSSSSSSSSASPSLNDPHESRFRMFDAFGELLRLASIEKPLVVILDDLHVVDFSTLELLRFVVRGARGSPRLLLVGTMRDAAGSLSSSSSSPAGARSRQQLLAQISSEAIAIPLARLTRDEVAAWIAAAVPDLAPNVDRLLSVSEGNPLFVGELLAAAKRHPGHLRSSTQELPVGIREAIRAHLATLPESAREVLAIASVLGRDFSKSALHAIRRDARSELEAAIAAGVIGSAGDHDERLRFTHVLIRDELYAGLAHERRAEIHREVASHEADPVLAINHWLAGGRGEDARAILAVARSAIEDAKSRFAFNDAAELGQRVLDAIAFEAREACELRILVAEAWVLAGAFEAARRCGARAAEEARKLGDRVLLARAALVHATEMVVGDRDDAAVELLRAALDALPSTDSAMRARLLARLSVAYLPLPPVEYARVLQMGSDAITMARRLDDDETLFDVLAFTRRTPAEIDDARTRFALNAETISLAKKLGKVPLVASLFGWQIAATIELGDALGLIREVDAMETLLAPYTQPAYRYQPLLVRAMLADIEGRFGEADALSREALRICEEHAVVPGLMLIVVQRIGFMYTRGDNDGWAEFEPMAIRLLVTGRPMSEIFRVMFDAMCDRPERVRASFALTKGIPFESLPDGAGLGAPCAAAGLVEYAAPLYDVLARAEETKGPWQFGPGRITSMGPRALTLGRLAMLLERRAEAIGHFERALALAESLRARPFVAQAHLELALARSGADARGHAETAHAIATEVGMRVVAARAAEVLEACEPTAKSSPMEMPSALALEREGEAWCFRWGVKRVVMKDAKGLSYLEALFAAPGREIHVLEIVGLRDDGDAGPMLDEAAKKAYRERAESLREELEDATRSADLGRAERMRAELEALATELTRAVGIGGRDRRAASPSERARINVQRRIRDVIARVRAADPAIGEYLQRSVRTGMFCIYLPLVPTKSG